MHYEYEILNYTFVPIQVYDSVFVSLLFISAVCILIFLSSSSIMTLLLRKTHQGIGQTVTQPISQKWNGYGVVNAKSKIHQNRIDDPKHDAQTAHTAQQQCRTITLTQSDTECIKRKSKQCHDHQYSHNDTKPQENAVNNVGCTALL